MPGHGEYAPGKGWFDASLNGWVDQPTKITPVRSSEVRHRPDLGLGVIPERKPLTERVGDTAAANWRPNAEMEKLRSLRDSDRVEERQMADGLLRGQRRMELGSYEAGLTAFLERGGELPEGVKEP